MRSALPKVGRFTAIEDEESTWSALHRSFMFGSICCLVSTSKGQTMNQKANRNSLRFRILTLFVVTTMATASLLVTAPQASAEESSPSPTECVDPDGDGWGWQGTWPAGGSCKVEDLAPPPVETLADTNVGVAAQPEPETIEVADTAPDAWLVDLDELTAAELDEDSIFLKVAFQRGSASFCPDIGPDNDDCVLLAQSTVSRLVAKNAIDPDGRAADAIIGVSVSVGAFLGAPSVVGVALGAATGWAVGLSAIEAINGIYAWGKRGLDSNRAWAQDGWAASVGATNGLNSNTTDADCGGCDAPDTSFDSTDADCGGCGNPGGSEAEGDAPAEGPGDSPDGAPY